ncbi:MAG: S-layer homology domain-containing protein [Candidatus Peribacteraceae bacterium]|jgi:hypothetical protein
MRVSRFPTIAASLLLILPILAQAVSFPDVTSSNAYKKEIEALSELGVISGNPDGTFRPDDPVNRAAMLKMLYLASGKTADVGSTSCFPDVGADAWYQQYVCDAAAKGYVKGYTDGTFKPGRPVSRSEAVKMVLTVFGIPVSSDSVVSLYIDVPSDTWFAPFIASALKASILPILGQEGPGFLPNELLTRGEAAAYIWNATQGSTGGTSSAAAASSTAGQGTASSHSQSSFDDTGASAAVKQVTWPFTDIENFKGTKPFSFRFTLTSPLVTDVTATLRESQTGSLSCTLYKLESDGLSTEYYLGYKEKTSCSLKTALTAGDYQLQLQPANPNTGFIIDAKTGTGDGNDGFSQATHLIFGKVHVDVLDGSDLEDWFTFTVTEPEEMTLSLVSTGDLRCLIYGGSDVDFFGFEGPACGKSYLYPTGTYHVGIGRPTPMGGRYTYSIRWE